MENVSEKKASKKTKREFLKFFLVGSFATWAGASLYQLARFFAPVASASRALPRFVNLEKRARDIPANSGFVFPFGYRPALLVRGKNGKLKAFFATCTHLACTVQYDPRSERIVCPCHDGLFDLNGKNIDGPPPSPLTQLMVKVDAEDRIRVIKPGKKT